MHDPNAAKLLAKVMDWDLDTVPEFLPKLQLLADYKYDKYQQFGPGRRFIENLALWLDQFQSEDRNTALKFVISRLVYISDAEFTHLVSMAYPDLIVQERMRLVADEIDIPAHLVGKISAHPRFKELQLKSLYLGLSDGARTNDLRRTSSGEISNEQIWQAYELSDEKADDMRKELESSLKISGLSPSNIDLKVTSFLENLLSNKQIWPEYELNDEKANSMREELKCLLENSHPNTEKPHFNLIWLLDDFSGSGNTYIRYDSKSQTFKGKIKKIFESLYRGDLVDPSHYEVYLLLYTATRQAIDHIEYWSERFTSAYGYKPLQLRVLCPIETEISLKNESDPDIRKLLENTKYYDEKASDKHIEVGGTKDARMGFAGCALPVVLSHNTPNNSVYILWGSESNKPFGLFPRVSRHREF